MEGRQEGVEPLHRAHDLSSLSGEVEAVARGDRSMQQCPAGRATTCPPGSRHAVVGRTLPSGAAIRGHWPGYRHQSGHVPDSVPSGRQSLPKHRTVNPPIAPTRYNFLHASSKPALRPGDDTTVTGAPAPPSTQVEPYASGNPERRNRRGLGQHPSLRTGQLPNPAVQYRGRAMDSLMPGPSSAGFSPTQALGLGPLRRREILSSGGLLPGLRCPWATLVSA
jgi:hypothetical protein